MQTIPNSPTLSQSGRLLSLARIRFADIDNYPVELDLLKSCATGETTKRGGPNDYPWRSDSDNAKTNGWGVRARQVRAILIRWLCIDREARDLVDAKGIQLSGVWIDGFLDLSYANIPFPLFLTSCWLASVDLSGSSIPVVNLAYSWGNRLSASGAKVAQGLVLTSFRADTGALMTGAQVGWLAWSGGSIGQYGLFAKGINVDHDLTLDAILGSQPVPFRVKGGVALDGAKVGGDLIMSGGKFEPNAAGVSISLVSAVVKGRLVVSTAPGSIGNAEYFEANGWIDIRLATSGTLEDDNISQPKRWGLEGFVYDRLILRETMFVSPAISLNYSDSINAKAGLYWLAQDGTGSMQPYDQFAKFLERIGDRRGAVEVRVAMEELLSRRNDTMPVHWLRRSISYGYAPQSAIYGLAIVTGLGALLYWRMHRIGAIVPTERDANDAFGLEHKLPAHYPRFSSLIYSLENTFPLVKLGQTGKWQPKPDEELDSGGRQLRRSSRFTRAFVLLQAIMGWLLAVLFAAAVSGLVQRGP